MGLRNAARSSVEPPDPARFTRKHDRYYTAFAGLYDAAVRRLPVWKTWLAQALPHIEGPRVLEVSFGTGYLLTRYADRVEAYGVDYNRAMVQTARGNLSRSARSASLVQGNVERLPYPDRTFDSLVNTMAFSGYPDGARALAEMKRVLRPGGRLILIDFSYPADGNRMGTHVAALWKLTGDLIRDMGRLFDEQGLDHRAEEIGGAGSVHLYLATRPPVEPSAMPGAAGRPPKDGRPRSGLVMGENTDPRDAPSTKLEHYGRRVGRWSHRIAPLFLDWLAREFGGRWLDVGCGGGVLGQAILDRLVPKEVASVDPSQQAIDALAPVRAGPCVVACAESLPFGPERFDTVVSGLVINALSDPIGGVREMARVTAPHGVVAGYVWDFAGGMEVMRTFWDAAIALDPRAREQDQSVRFPLCRPERLAALFSDAGLVEVETRSIDARADFVDFGDYWSPWTSGDGSIVRYVQSLSDDARMALRARIEETLPRSASGGIRLGLRAWAIRARPDPGRRSDAPRALLGGSEGGSSRGLPRTERAPSARASDAPAGCHGSRRSES